MSRVRKCLWLAWMACPRASDGGDVLESSKVEVEVGEDESARHPNQKIGTRHAAQQFRIPPRMIIMSSVPLGLHQSRSFKPSTLSLVNYHHQPQDVVC
jgi:hypothetical protein